MPAQDIKVTLIDKLLRGQCILALQSDLLERPVTYADCVESLEECVKAVIAQCPDELLRVLTRISTRNEIGRRNALRKLGFDTVPIRPIGEYKKFTRSTPQMVRPPESAVTE